MIAWDASVVASMGVRDAMGLMLARMLKERGHTVVIGGTVYAKFVPQLMRRPRFFELFCDGLVPYEPVPTVFRYDRVPSRWARKCLT